jgi:hypothetical protein
MKKPNLQKQPARTSAHLDSRAGYLEHANFLRQQLMLDKANGSYRSGNGRP